MKKIITYLLLLTMSAMLLTGCGGSDTPKTEASSVEETKVNESEITENVEEEKEVVEGIGIQTIEGKNEETDFTITYDGDVLLLKNEDELSDVSVVRFASLEDKSTVRVTTDEKSFSDKFERTYNDTIEHYKEFDREVKYGDGTVEQLSYPEVVPSELTDKTIGNISGKYFNLSLVASNGEVSTWHYFMFDYNENYYTEVSYEASTEEQSLNFEKLVEAVTVEITCEGMLPGNASGVASAGQEKDINKVQLLYNDGASKMEISYNQMTVHIDEYFLAEPQSELEVIYDNGNGSYRYLFSTDNANYTSVDDFYQINVNDCKKMFSDAAATELKEIPCGNITFYTFTMTYTDNQNNAVTAPLYFAEIEPGVYIYTNLGDTMQFGDVNEDKLATDLEMLKETFINIVIL